MGGRPQVDEVRARAERGDAIAQLGMGTFYDQGGFLPQDLAQAAKWYRASAEQGNTEAQNSLGSLYQFGQGVPQDYSQAKTWYEKAAAQGSHKALNSLGYLYDLGLGVPEDNVRAVKLYTEAAEKGNTQAMKSLGLVYAKGEPGVSRDVVEAFKWLNLARFYTQSSNDMRLKWQVRGLLDELKKDMTSAQIARGEQLSMDWDSARWRK